MTKMKGKSGRSLHVPPGLPFDSEAGHPAFSKPVIPSGHQLHRAVYGGGARVDLRGVHCAVVAALDQGAVILPNDAPHIVLPGHGPCKGAVDDLSARLVYVEANRHILNCAYDAMGRDELRRFFYTDFIEITLSLVEQAELHTGCQTDPEFKRFLAEFYTEALAGMLINLFKAKDFPYSKAEIRENIILLLKTALPAALRAGAAKGAEHPF